MKTMKKIVISILFATLTTIGLHAQNARYLPGTVVVKLSNSKQASNRLQDFEFLCNAKIKRASKLFMTKKQDRYSAEMNRILRIEYEGNESPMVVARKLAQSEGFDYAEPYWIPELFELPDDPFTDKQYFLSITQAIDAYDITHGDTNIVIGIIDTGFDVYHEDLAQNIKYNYADPINGIDDDGDGFVDNYRGWDMANNDNNPVGSLPHGSHVAGSACATTNNGIGVAGTGYLTKFLPIKATDDDSGALSACYEGVVYAADHGCQIINCSWGSPAQSMLCNDVIKYAQSRGCLVVAAAGNTGTDVKYYPASCDGVISVCATNSADNKWNGSTYNHRVDVAAPGEGIFTASGSGKYQSSSGTSFAAPIVSAAAALVWSVRPNLSAVQIGELLRTTADNIDTIPANAKYAGKMGSGRINILRAITDNSSPSIRVTNYTFSGNDNDFMSGEEVKIGISICNYLEKADNVTITLESPDNSLKVENGTWSAGSIDKMKSVDVPDFTAVIADSLDNNTILPVRIKFEADGYSAAQTIELTVNPNFRDIEWGCLKTTIADNGKIGIYDYDSQLGSGLLYQKAQKLISDGALIFALDSSKISSSYQSDNQFSATNGRPIVESVENITHIKSAIKPNNISGIEILQDFVFDSQNLPNAMICKYQIISSRDDSFDNASLGLYFDWDVVNSLTNKIEYDATRQLAYIYNTGDIGIYGGVRLLTNGNATPYAFEIGDKSQSINIKDDFNDELKWIAMNQARPTSTTDNIDLAMLLSCNKISIPAHDTTLVAFAVLAAENLYELTQTANTASKLYGEKKSTNEDSCFITDTHIESATISPNPATSTITINCRSNMSAVKIFSPSGYPEAVFETSGTQATIDISSLKAGLHVVEITCVKAKTKHLMIKL